MNRNLRRYFIHGGLFVVTFATATMVQGPWYAVAIMTILLAHELGHYLTARRYRVEATFPVFIPMPNILGTLGAVIAMRSPIPHRRALFDIGISGPLVGLAFAVPAIIIGLHFSEIRPVPTDGPVIYFGEPILFSWLATWILGPVPDGHDIFLNPVAFAGWAALFVTSINFFPVGQLDGGHVAYAVFGRRRARMLSWLVVITLLYLGYRYQPLWYFFAALIALFVMRHPAPTDDVTPVDPRRRWLGLATYALMILCFTPVPFDFRL